MWLPSLLAVFVARGKCTPGPAGRDESSVLESCGWKTKQRDRRRMADNMYGLLAKKALEEGPFREEVEQHERADASDQLKYNTVEAAGPCRS